MGAAKSAVSKSAGANKSITDKVVNSTGAGRNLNSWMNKNLGHGFEDPTMQVLNDPKKWGAMFGYDGKTISDDQKKAALKSLGVTLPDDIPKPDYIGMTDSQGNLLPQYKMGNADAWLGQQTKLQGLRTQADLGNATQAGLGQRASAETALAARGGMDSGARERMAMNNARNTNLQQQGVRGTAEQNTLGLQSDAFGKNQAADQANIQTLTANNQNQNMYNANNYNQQMQAWAAGKQAKATASAGKK